MSERFPVLHGAGLTSVPWEFVECFRASAEQVHGQTLERLAQRGGLSPLEMMTHYDAVVEGRRARLRDFDDRDASADEKRLRELTAIDWQRWAMELAEQQSAILCWLNMYGEPQHPGECPLAECPKCSRTKKWRAALAEFRKAVGSGQ